MYRKVQPKEIFTLRKAMNSLLILCTCCMACSRGPDREITRSFYYWKTVFAPTAFEKTSMDTLQVQKIYLRYFDVAWNPASGSAAPRAQTVFSADGMDWLKKKKMDLVPVVFITNECLVKIDSAAAVDLGKRVLDLVTAMNRGQQISSCRELQIDCDWTVATRENYFILLKALRHALPDSQLLSATIRLHQLKYKSRTGIPPVNRGMLMCYNMGNLRDPQAKNSILDLDEMKKYVGALDHYQLPLDIALPLFDWKILFRQQQFNGIVYGLSAGELPSDCVEQRDGHFVFLRDTTLRGYDFKKGDWLRDEQVSENDLLDAAALINKNLPKTPSSVILYHLDSLLLKKYPTHELEKVFVRLR